MSDLYKKFLIDSEKKAFDKEHRKTIKFNISKYDAAVKKGKPQYKDIELAKERASLCKEKVVNNLDKYLVQFEANFLAKGGKVIWAQDASEAIFEVLNIVKSRNAKLVVKSKSMTTEEIELNKHLEDVDVEVIETDLGEYIVQVDNDKPYHIVTPAMHKSKKDIAELFNREFGTPIESSAEEITAYVRDKLRKKFIAADIGITGGNFLIADTGSVGLTENEGNGFMSVSLPKVHIAIVGIEKIIPSMDDLANFWPILSTHGTGQKITVYNSIISGPKKENEKNGPDEMFVILLDNGRTELLKQKEQREALKCIRCGACLNVCPVYKNIGGHTYNFTYSGPIGKVIAPYLGGMGNYKHLSFASSLCGRCTQECPVKIPLHELMLLNRRDSVKLGYKKKIDDIVMSNYKMVMKNRWMINSVNGDIKNIFVRMFFKKAWGPRRKLPKIKKKSFNHRWNRYSKQ